MHQLKLILSLLAAFGVASAAGRSHGQTLTTLTSFDGTDGASPWASLILSGSTLYGTTQTGGVNGMGNVFSIPVTGGAPTTLTSFNGANGSIPNGNVTLVGSTLYGTTQQGGGSFNAGTVFSIPVAGGTPTTLANFNPGFNSSGGDPYAGLTLIGSTFYGTNGFGGPSFAGTVFSVPITGGDPSTVTSFDIANGASPLNNLTVIGSTLYGTTVAGGANGDGTIFSIPVSGGDPTTLFSFDGPHGSEPWGGLTLSADGSTFYGMTNEGGAGGDGTIFSIPVTGGTPTILASFDGTNGLSPFGSLTLSADGATLYGMTQAGGVGNHGTIFSISAAGGPLTNLFSFNGTNGEYPSGDLTLDGSTLYGMTSGGGANGDGTVFALALTPEPSSLVLLGLGAIGLGAIALRRRTRNQAA